MQDNNLKITLPFVLKLASWLALNVSIFYFDDFLKQHPFFNNVAVGLNFFLIASILFSIGRYLIIMLYTRRHANKSMKGNFVLGINRLTAVLNTSFAIVMLMIFLNIDPREFLTSMTIVAMAIAVTFREYITNMISGLIIMFSEQMSVGDHIIFNNLEGKIVDITLANLVVLNDDNNLVMIPNNLFFTSAMVNKSARISSLCHVKFELPFEYSKHIAALEQRLTDFLTEHPKVHKTDTIRLKVSEIGKDFVKYKINFYLVDTDRRLQKEVENEVLMKVLTFKAENI